jgi:hypothetical protein
VITDITTPFTRDVSFLVASLFLILFGNLETKGYITNTRSEWTWFLETIAR